MLRTPGAAAAATMELERKIGLKEWLEESGWRVGIVFTDIVGSTLLVESKRTKNYGQIVRTHKARATRLAAEFEGRIVSRVGDQHLAVFRTVRNAFDFARAFFHDTGHPQLRIRAGVHFGTVGADDDGLVGRSVNRAARVMSHGRESELWVSDVAKRMLDDDADATGANATWLKSEVCHLKGIAARQRLWRAA